MITIKLHSMTDLITNSSTTLFTNSDQSPRALEEMVDEFFRALGIDQKCSDIFTMVVMQDNTYTFYDWVNENKKNLDIPEEIRGDTKSYRNEKLDELIAGIVGGKIEKPEWFKDMELDSKREDTGTTLHIAAKDPKFEKLAGLVQKFLYSTETEEGYNG